MELFNKRFLSGAALAFLSVSGVTAADFVLAPPPPLYAEEVVSEEVTVTEEGGVVVANPFSGFYVGVTGAYQLGNVKSVGIKDDTTKRVGVFGMYSSADDPAEYTASLAGLAFGGQLGYNLDLGGFIVGAEIGGVYSLAKATFDEKLALNATAGSAFSSINLKIEDAIQWYGYGKARVGYSVGSFMLYGAGGGAYVNLKQDQEAVFTPTSGNAITVTNNATGPAVFTWTAGGGAEVMVTDSISLGVDYMFVPVKATRTISYNTGNGSKDFEQELNYQIHDIRASLIYHLN